MCGGEPCDAHDGMFLNDQRIKMEAQFEHAR